MWYAVIFFKKIFFFDLCVTLIVFILYPTLCVMLIYFMWYTHRPDFNYNMIWMILIKKSLLNIFLLKRSSSDFVSHFPFEKWNKFSTLSPKNAFVSVNLTIKSSCLLNVTVGYLQEISVNSANFLPLCISVHLL